MPIAIAYDSYFDCEIRPLLVFKWVDSDILPMIQKSVSFNVSQFFSHALPLHLLCDGTASNATITPQVCSLITFWK